VQPFESNGLEGFFIWKEVNALSTGAIICVAGEVPENWSEADEADFRKTIDAFDAIRIMPLKMDADQLQCQWLDLIRKGMTEVVIWRAEFTESGRLEVNRQLGRLSIVAPN
jgi:hypothetical protein